MSDHKFTADDAEMFGDGLIVASVNWAHVGRLNTLIADARAEIKRYEQQLATVRAVLGTLEASRARHLSPSSSVSDR